MSNYFNILVERSFGTPSKNFSSKPKSNASVFQELLAQIVPLDNYNAGSTIYRNHSVKHRFLLKKITQECGIEHVKYSFDGSAEKFLCRIQKLSCLPLTTFSGKILNSIKNAVLLKSAEHSTLKFRKLILPSICPGHVKSSIGKCSEKFLLKSRKHFAHIGENLPKQSSMHVKISFSDSRDEVLLKSPKINRAFSEKHPFRNVRLTSLQNAFFTTLLETFRSTSGNISGEV